jgi:methanol metabolism-related c-type cytochrome
LKKFSSIGLALCVCAFLAGCGGTEGSVKNVDGKYYDREETPTFKVQRDGTVDWYTFSGYLRFNSTCAVCHGPDGAGSTFAPVLANSLKTLSYRQFIATVSEGRKIASAAEGTAMPSFRQNKNVMCYLDDIYVYLRARAAGAVGRGKPGTYEPKSPAAGQAEEACLGAFPRH